MTTTPPPGDIHPQDASEQVTQPATPEYGLRDQLRIIMAEGLADAKNTTILYDHGHLVADLVLGSPEMQAIRCVLRDTYRVRRRDGYDMGRYDLDEMRAAGLHESVIRWVIGDA